MRPLLCLSLLVGLAAPAAAQSLDAAADPAGETVRARSGRDAATVDLTLRASQPHPNSECAGQLDPSAPDAVVNWDGGPLQFWVRGAFDATMTVIGPDGAVRCEDDSEGRLPIVAYGSAPRGRYAVWVGAFGGETEGQAVTLYAGTPAIQTTLDPGGRPTDGTIRLRAGFEAEAAEGRDVSAAGADALGDVDAADGASCAGFVRADRPSTRIRYEGGGQPLVIQASGDGDLVLAAMTPAGLFCNDDWDPTEGTDPAIVIEDAASGDYAVWVGTWSSHAATEAPRATLRLSETAPPLAGPIIDGGDFPDDFDMDAGFDPYSTGTFTPFDPGAAPRRTVSAPFTADGEASMEVTAEGEIPTPIQGDACSGWLPARPQLAMALDATGPIALRAASTDTDLVLTARLPDGTWMCSDDADGTDPGIQIDGAQRGTLTVWVGTFGGMQTADATVTLAAGTVEREMIDMPDDGPTGAPFMPGTYSGSALQTDAPLQTLALRGARVRANVRVAGDLANPVEGPACVGFVTARPSAAVNVETGGALTVRAFSATDAVMVVRTPGGDWFCSDDAERTEPEVRFEQGAAGTYSVWLGTFSNGGEPAQMTLLVARPTDG